MLASIVGAAAAPRASAQSYQQVMRERGLALPGLVRTTEDKRWRRVKFPGRQNTRVRRSVGSAFTSRHFTAYFHEAATTYKLPVAFLCAVTHVESHFDPTVVSVDGAMGLMQMMPFTAKQMGVVNAHDPRQNILGGARYLRILTNRWRGDLVRVIASYNAGPGAVQKYRGIPPYAETRRYVGRVLERFRFYATTGCTGPIPGHV